MAMENQLPIIKLLVQGGADIHAGVKHENMPNHIFTARDFADEIGYTEIVEYLDSLSSDKNYSTKYTEKKCCIQ